jgi:hypothetical protein
VASSRAQIKKKVGSNKRGGERWATQKIASRGARASPCDGARAAWFSPIFRPVPAGLFYIFTWPRFFAARSTQLLHKYAIKIYILFKESGAFLPVFAICSGE